MQTDRVGDFVELFVADVLELFAFRGQLLVNLNGLFGHDFMRLLGTTHEDKIRAGGQALMAVLVQTDTEHHGFAAALLLARIRHEAMLKEEGRERQSRASQEIPKAEI